MSLRIKGEALLGTSKRDTPSSGRMAMMFRRAHAFFSFFARLHLFVTLLLAT